MAKDLRICLLLDFYANMLTDKQREAVDLYYNEDLSLAEISEHTGITRQGVRDSIKHAESILLDTEQRLGFAARFESQRGTVNEMLAAADELDELNARHQTGAEMSKLIETIRQGVRDIARD